jgi:hypothetical protein
VNAYKKTKTNPILILYSVYSFLNLLTQLNATLEPGTNNSRVTCANESVKDSRIMVTLTVLITATLCVQLEVTGNQNDNGYSKGKAIPLQALTGPEGSRRLRLPDFKTIGT